MALMHRDTHTDGILEVRIPCPETAEPVPTKIPVNRR